MSERISPENQQQNPLQIAQQEFNTQLFADSATFSGLKLVRALHAIKRELAQTGVDQKVIYPQLIASANLAVTRSRMLEDELSATTLEEWSNAWQSTLNFLDVAAPAVSAPTNTETLPRMRSSKGGGQVFPPTETQTSGETKSTDPTPPVKRRGRPRKNPSAPQE